MKLLPDLAIVDDALSYESWKKWVERVELLKEMSTPADPDMFRDSAGEELLSVAERLAGPRTGIIQAVLFAIEPWHRTTTHVDTGEYVVLYYPVRCPTGPLHIQTWKHDVAVSANRLVAFNATKLAHRQNVPASGTRYSVSLKFRHP